MICKEIKKHERNVREHFPIVLDKISEMNFQLFPQKLQGRQITYKMTKLIKKMEKDLNLSLSLLHRLAKGVFHGIC